MVFVVKLLFTLVIFSIHGSCYERFASEVWKTGLILLKQRDVFYELLVKKILLFPVIFFSN